MAYDMTVVRTAYSTAKGMGASDKVMLALFEAGIVESGFRNLNYGDRDSVGFLQQRPSQGWPNPTDVPTATRSFVSKAKAVEGKHATAGQLAQAVQRSAFPLKYDAVKPAAQALLNQVSSGAGATVPVDNAEDTSGITKVLKTLGDNHTWVRVGLFIAGGFFILYGLMKATGDNQLSETTKTLAKTAVQATTKVKVK